MIGKLKKLIGEQIDHFAGLDELVKLGNHLNPEVRFVLKNNRPVYLFNEHQWALYSWLHALEQGSLSEGATLLHVDAHHDLYSKYVEIFSKMDLRQMESCLRSEKISCGNFIVHALRHGLVNKMFWMVPKWGACSRKESVHKFKSVDSFYNNYFPPFYDIVKKTQSVPEVERPLILDIDLDYFANMGLSLEDAWFYVKSYVTDADIDARVDQLFNELKGKEVNPNIVTIADSDQMNIYTPHSKVEYIRSRVLECLEDL